MENALAGKVRRWVDAGIVDAATGTRILDFEAAHEQRTGLNWPVVIAMLFGGILLAAGVTLFVAAHWAELSPAMRFTLVLLMVAVFHAGGATAAEKFPALSTTLHGVGTATLGAAIFLAAQIFNLHENWATGILLWALGAAAGYWLLRDWVQAAFVAVLVPAWLIGEWDIATAYRNAPEIVIGVGLITTALCYLSARIGHDDGLVRRVLVWIGALALIPVTLTAVGLALEDFARYKDWGAIPAGTRALGWFVAIAAPLLLALALRGRAAWMNVAWTLWAWVMLETVRKAGRGGPYGVERGMGMTALMYGLLALGSVALVAWGLNEKRRERVNLGVACFAFSVLFFYFDGFMGKLGRSESLILLGVLCLAGGFVLEKTRRKLVARMGQTA